MTARDADMDLLAWDLGNPGGAMITAGGEQMHPMKGPMTTQTLRGLRTLEPFHWRGDGAAFLLSFDTGTAPAVGYSRTLSKTSLDAPATGADWLTLEQRAAAGTIDLVLKGTIEGERRGLVYRPTTDDYRTDRTGVGPFTRAQLREKIAAGDTLTFMGVPAGSGTRMGVDRDADGVLDGDVGMPVPVLLSHVADVATTTASGAVETTFRRRDTVFWRVRLQDQFGNPVAGASVQTALTFGTTRLALLTATSGADDVAVFSRRTNGDMSGTYTVSVSNVSSPEMAYDSTANVESSTMYVLRK